MVIIVHPAYRCGLVLYGPRLRIDSCCIAISMSRSPCLPAFLHLADVDPWNTLVDRPWKIMCIGLRQWAHEFLINEIWY